MHAIRKQAARALAAAAATVAIAAIAPSAHAIEGAVQYPHGAEGFFAGALPPPGTYFLLYGIYYDGTLQDGDGDDVLVGGETVDLEVNAIAPRVVHMTDTTILGGQWGMHAVVPFFRNTLETAAGKDTRTGLGDITVNPFILAWHRPDLHWAIGLDINIPTGSYDKDRANNIGANYWSFEPLAAVTWLPGDGWQVNAKAMYNIKLENPDTDYRSGDELHVDYTIGKSITDNLTLGVGGYWIHQVNDDEKNGVGQGKKARVLSVGPQLKWDIGHTSLIAKWHHEVYARDAFEGDRFMLKLVTPF